MKNKHLGIWLAFTIPIGSMLACNFPSTATPSPIPPATITATPLPTPLPGTATPTPDFNSGLAYGEIISFSVLPVEAQSREWRQIGPGDSITISWEAKGTSVMIDIDNAGVSFGDGKQNLPLKGSLEWTLRNTDPVADHWVDVRLSARGEINDATQTIRLYVRCHYQWFQAGLSTWCPGQWVDERAATAQNFEHGVIFSWSPADFTVMLDSGVYRWYFWGYGMPDPTADTSTLSPPSGLFVPDQLFVALWLGKYAGAEDLRALLGWATSAPDEFTWKSQCEKTPNDISAICYSIAPSGKVYIVEEMTHDSPDPNNKDKPVVNEGRYRLIGE